MLRSLSHSLDSQSLGKGTNDHFCLRFAAAGGASVRRRGYPAPNWVKEALFPLGKSAAGGLMTALAGSAPMDNCCLGRAEFGQTAMRVR